MNRFERLHLLVYKWPADQYYNRFLHSSCSVETLLFSWGFSKILLCTEQFITVVLNWGPMLTKGPQQTWGLQDEIKTKQTLNKLKQLKIMISVILIHPSTVFFLL